jgi:hypothetical protein
MREEDAEQAGRKALLVFVCFLSVASFFAGEEREVGQVPRRAFLPSDRIGSF